MVMLFRAHASHIAVATPVRPAQLEKVEEIQRSVEQTKHQQRPDCAVPQPADAVEYPT
ncbi:hypothetical protein CCHOA_06820 [Corynebacterium choanae]|uniref:Uncharacterized protein n=2 Tax=Corynebacterium choanae TaxID=1862358 RepID=A0A3G6J703_9CORY|nr:hypothetical protein CCHOA_06820 [Corynebacterium choanae]